MTSTNEINGQALYMLTGEQILQIAQDAAQKASDAVRKELKNYNEYGASIWTVKEVADMFHVDPRTINNWIRAGIIKTMKLGSIVRIDGREIVRVREQYARV